MKLPASVPVQKWRTTQKEIPNHKGEREHLKKFIANYVNQHKPVPPLTDPEIKHHVFEIIAELKVNHAYEKYVTVLFNNECWRDTLASVPYERRLLLLPKCLRVEERCPAPFDEFGLLCKQCGLCTIEDLEKEAHRLGYAVLVAEGSAIVMKIIESNKIEAIVGVSCLSVLEKAYPFMEAAAIPGVAIPLLQDDCKDTNVDVDWVWDVIHLTSDDKSHRLDLEKLKESVQACFERAELTEIMGEATTVTEELAISALSEEGKRWRPYLSACAAKALQEDSDYNLDLRLKKIIVAIECFHKASLIHDDIEDEDDERYNKATLHKSHGVAIALNVGDFLLGEGYRLIASSGLSSEKIADMMSIASVGHRQLSVGQGEELNWYRSSRALSSLEVLEIFKSKTSPAFEVALRMGAVYAGAEEEVHEVLKNYSENLGIAYQIQDDSDDFLIESSSDNQALRPTLFMALALEKAKGDDADFMRMIWESRSTDAVNPQRIIDIVTNYKVNERCEELLESYKEAAVRSLQEMEDPTLKGLMRRVIGKIFNDIEIRSWCSESEKGNVAGSEVSSYTAS